MLRATKGWTDEVRRWCKGRECLTADPFFGPVVMTGFMDGGEVLVICIIAISVSLISPQGGSTLEGSGFQVSRAEQERAVTGAESDKNGASTDRRLARTVCSFLPACLVSRWRVTLGVSMQGTDYPTDGRGTDCER